MGRTRSIGCIRGGGDSIPPLRALRIRVGLAAATAALACALAAYPIVKAGSITIAVAPLATVGLVFTALALLLRSRFAGAAIFSLAIEYVVVEATGRAGSLSVVAYAVGLVIFSELLFSLPQFSPPALADRSLIAARLVGIGLAGAGAALLAVVSLAAGSLRLSGGFQGALIGAAAAAALLALPWLLLLRRGSRR